MSAFLQTLVQANAIYVKQKFELAEIFGFETRNRYQIQTDDGRLFGYCAEPKLGFMDAIGRQFLGHWRVFNIVGTDLDNQQVFRANHPFRWFFQRLDIFGAGDRPVGSLQQRFAWFSKKFDFLDTRGRVVMTMTSPLWKIWTFPIKKGERDVSVIEKKWTGLTKELFTDADNFRVRFTDAKLTADEKLLLLAGAVFVDLLYFETKASS
ncbi:Scramblase [Tumidithrix helvetica PCC 7403]|uniref:phospholipid scramblase-related protein n=1 Tax=Tumidithrix helvetica TaxID=3457545 RepID=UPI003CA2616C